MGVNSLPKTVTRQHSGCNLNPGPSAPESSTLTTRLLSHTYIQVKRNSVLVRKFKCSAACYTSHMGGNAGKVTCFTYMYRFIDLWQPSAGLYLHSSCRLE